MKNIPVFKLDRTSKRMLSLIQDKEHRDVMRKLFVDAERTRQDVVKRMASQKGKESVAE